METVEEGRVDHDVREWGQEMTCLRQRIDRLVDIPDEHHRCRLRHGITPLGKRAGSHEILHDLQAVLVLKRDAGHFIESDYIPKAHQADSAAGHIVEKVCHGGLAARDQDAVRATFFVNVALALPRGPSSQTL